MRALVPLVLVLLTGCDDRAANEERLLVDRADRIDPSAPIPIRRQQIGDLEGLALRSESLVELRDTCVEGYRALIRAEEEQARAGRSLAEVTEGDRGGPLSPEKAAEIEAAIEASNTAVDEARGLLRRCQDELARLKSKHG